jgi:hypothetical protein
MVKIGEKNVQKFHPMKLHRGNPRIARINLNSVTDEGEWVNSSSGHFTPGNNRDN